MSKPTLPAWLVDTRFWVALFVVGFWPAVLLGKFVGLAILLVVTVGGAAGTHWFARRARGAPADHV